ncbi:MAG: ribose 5-phosphate isomerase B [Ferrimicrobium sp.]
MVSLEGIVVAIGSDHAGFQLKEIVRVHLEDAGAVLIDFGTFSEEPTDYPLFCQPTAEAVAKGAAALGVVVGGSGQGEQIVANKVRGIRAALCYNELSAQLARRHNDANVLSLGARLLGTDLALSIVDAFFAASFDGGRHLRRIGQITEVEEGVSFLDHRYD